ncbi:MAG: class I SAM-dependent methyltransferase [Gammaproteobacteria bacterium]|nr:class I SAM-dependent methyltransferase [Gammaproteobacteria bacterium]
MNISDYIIDKVRLNREHEPPYLFPGNRWGWLPDLCNLAGFAVGAEIGVSGGRFTKRLCDTVPGLKMYAIDPWEWYDYYGDRSNQWRMDRAHRKALEVLTPLNCEIIRDYSAQAVGRFTDGSLDFIYLDANRSFEGVTQDLTLWSEKVRPGGIICGCCYYNERDYKIGQVKKAVDFWTAAHGIDPWFVLVHHRYPCYLWERP